LLVVIELAVIKPESLLVRVRWFDVPTILRVASDQKFSAEQALPRLLGLIGMRSGRSTVIVGGDCCAEEADFEAGGAEEGGGFAVDNEEGEEPDAGDEGEDAEEDAETGAVDFDGEHEDEDRSDDADGEEGEADEGTELGGNSRCANEDDDIDEDADKDGFLAGSDFADALVGLGVVEDGVGILGREIGRLGHGSLLEVVFGERYLGRGDGVKLRCVGMGIVFVGR
jgi:hypothetical protein